MNWWFYLHDNQRSFFSSTDGIERFIVRKYPLGAFGKTFSADSYKIVENQEPIFKIYIYNISKNAVFQVQILRLKYDFNDKGTYCV